MIVSRIRRAFQKVHSQKFDDFGIEGVVWQGHAGSKAVWLKSEDKNKAFSVVLKTVPQDDTGSPHCLEHIALCGSQKYPVRDPFMKMLTRSLNTFMNAMTGMDFTMYPFSTQNETDYKNLLNVYLDSVYFPLLKQNDFLQEAWRYEIVEGKLRYKGVVYNEMKGAMSDPNDYLFLALNKQLFEGTSYQYNYGGDPEYIPTLSHQGLIDFHRRYYHPSNSTFLMYGDMDPEPILQQIQETVLNHYEYQPIQSDISLVSRWNQPKEITLSAAPDSHSADPERVNKYCLTFLCNQVAADPYETFCLGILSYTLLRTQKAPLYKALIESGIGISFLQGSGYDFYTKEGTFTIGLNGIKEQDFTVARKVIFETLQKCYSQGIDKELLESAIHQTEIKQKQVKTNFGIMLMSSMLPYLLHGSDPFVPLQINSYVSRLKNEMDSGIPVFENLLHKHLLSNPHYISINLIPNEQFLADINSREQARLKAVDSNLRDEDKQQILSQMQQLEQDQDSKQNLDLLPTLTVNDIKLQEDSFDFNIIEDIEGVKTYWVEAPTNGIGYVRFKVNIKDLPEDLRPYMPLYTRLVNQLGTSKLSAGDFDARKGLYTLSGISGSVQVTSDINNLDNFNENYVFSVAFLNRNINKAFDILKEFLFDIRLNDPDHLQLLIQKSVKNRIDNLVNNGLEYAFSYSSASLSPSAQMYESLQSLRFDVQNLYSSDQIQNNSDNQLNQSLKMQALNTCIDKFTAIHNILLNKNRMQILVNTSSISQTHTSISENIQNLLQQLQVYTTTIQSPIIQPFNPFYRRNYFKLPQQVNNIVQSIKTVPYTHEDYPLISLLGTLLTHNFLLKEVREKGGAYGSGAKQDFQNGVFAMYSFRDPNLMETFEAFKRCVQQCVNGEFDDRNLDEAKLSAFSRLDMPISPSAKGLQEFMNGVDTHIRQQNRNRIFNASKTQLMTVAQKYVFEALLNDMNSKVVFGTSEEIDSKSLSEWIIETPIQVRIKQQTNFTKFKPFQIYSDLTLQKNLSQVENDDINEFLKSYQLFGLLALIRIWSS